MDRNEHRTLSVCAAMKSLSSVTRFASILAGLAAVTLLGCVAAQSTPNPRPCPRHPASTQSPNTAPPFQPGVSESVSKRSSGVVAGPKATETAKAGAQVPRRRRFVDVIPEEVNWSEHFAAEEVAGGFILYDAEQERAWVHGHQATKTPYLPASTYKIPHTAIALELGVLQDESTMIPWDGKRRWNPDWNYDTRLRDAMRFSVVPFYQEVARRIGPDRMTDWLERFEYGNRSIEGGIDAFWLIGGLRVTAVQQIDFLQRLNEGTLPISKRTRRIVRDVLFLGQRGASVLRAKTGSADALDDLPEVKWFVGWVERPEKQPVYFAAILTQTPPNARAASRQVSDRILRSLSYW